MQFGQARRAASNLPGTSTSVRSAESDIKVNQLRFLPIIAKLTILPYREN